MPSKFYNNRTKSVRPVDVIPINNIYLQTNCIGLTSRVC